MTQNTENHKTTDTETDLPEGVHKDADGKFHTETEAREAELRKRIEEIRKRDPFIYK